MHRHRLARIQDAAWRIVYRLGFPLARCWWRLRRPRHQGALVAVHVGEELLLVRSSYRVAWNFPGGGLRPGESPQAAARRELAEEIGVAASMLQDAGEARGTWDGRPDHVFFFSLRLGGMPELRVDNREIVEARLFSPAELRRTTLTDPVRIYVETRMNASPTDN